MFAASLSALDSSLRGLTKTYGADQSMWLPPTPVISFSAQGAGWAPDMPFENRGTFVQAIGL